MGQNEKYALGPCSACGGNHWFRFDDTPGSSGFFYPCPKTGKKVTGAGGKWAIESGLPDGEVAVQTTPVPNLQ